MTDEKSVADASDYRKQAIELTKSCADLQHQVLIKHTAAVLEELHAQISIRDAKIAALKLTLGTLISWSSRELGSQAVDALLKMLEAK